MTRTIPPDLLDRYRTVLARADAWFATMTTRFPAEIRCGAGCHGCCRGLFDITLLDAALLRDGFARLPVAQRTVPLEKARQQLAALQRRWPDFAPPYLLNLMDDAEWTEMAEDDDTPCPLLDGAGRCLVYAERPLTCRLHGLPQVDVDGELWLANTCSHNFPERDPLAEPGLRGDFRTLFRDEFGLQQELALTLTGTALTELDTFIPLALLIDFHTFDWRGWTAAHISQLTRYRQNI